MISKVFILDHCSLWSHFVAETLSVHSYDTTELRSQEEVISLLEDLLEDTPLCEKYPLLIVDSLSDRTENNRVKFLEVAKTIAERFPKVLLIVASSRPTPDEAVRAFAAGGSAYMFKTFDERQLMKSVTQAIYERSSRGCPETAYGRQYV